MLNSSKQPSPFISRVELRERVYAFIVTSAAVFVVTCLIWPLSVTGFRSVVQINVLAGAGIDSTEQLEQMLGFAVKNETDDQRLSLILDEIAASGKLSSNLTDHVDHVSIKNGIKFGVQKINQEYLLTVVYDGEGGQDERALVDILSARVANRLATQANRNIGDASLKNLEQASWIVDQIEDDLELVKASLNQMATNPTQRPLQSESNSNGTGRQFHQASSSKTVESGFDGLAQTIDSIDVESLRSILFDVKQQVTGGAGTDGSGAEPNSSNSSFAVTGLTTSKTIPISGVPGIGVLLALGALAGMVGTVIAGHYDPFASRGFSGVEAIGKALGVSVVATIGSQEPAPARSGDGSGVKGIGWANHVVKTAGLILFGIFVVIAGFILTNTDVRQAFFENPFFGCAKIVRIFVGY